jgi:hypothetical protein
MRSDAASRCLGAFWIDGNLLPGLTLLVAIGWDGGSLGSGQVFPAPSVRG